MTNQSAKDGGGNDTTTTPEPFISIELHGGPHDGQHMRVPHTQQRVELLHADRRHIYYRLGRRPVFHHRDIAAGVLGGAA